MRKLLASTLAAGVLLGGAGASAALAAPRHHPDHSRDGRAAATSSRDRHHERTPTRDRAGAERSHDTGR